MKRAVLLLLLSATALAQGKVAQRRADSECTAGTFTAAGFDSKRCIEGPDNKYAYYYLDGISLKAVPKE